MHQPKCACGEQEALALHLSRVVLCMVIAEAMASYRNRNPSIKQMSFLFNVEPYTPVVHLAFKHGHNKVLLCNHQKGSRNVFIDLTLLTFLPCFVLTSSESCHVSSLKISLLWSFCLLRLHVAEVCSTIPFICLKWFCRWDTNFILSAESSCITFISEKCSLSFSSSNFHHCPASSRIVHLSFQDFFSKTLKLQFMSALKSLSQRCKRVESVSKCNKLYKFWFFTIWFSSSPDNHVGIHRSSETLGLEWIQIAVLMQCVACEVLSSDMFVLKSYITCSTTGCRAIGITLKLYSLENRRREIWDLPFHYGTLHCTL